MAIFWFKISHFVDEATTTTTTTQVALLGELDKYVLVSKDRIKNVSLNSAKISMELSVHIQFFDFLHFVNIIKSKFILFYIHYTIGFSWWTIAFWICHGWGWKWSSRSRRHCWMHGDFRSFWTRPISLWHCSLLMLISITYTFIIRRVMFWHFDIQM